MKNLIRLVSFLIFILSELTYCVAQTSYTGYFYGTSNEGMHTDQYFNLVPNSGATQYNSWNLYHADGLSMLTAYFAAPQPSIYVGQSRLVNFYVNGMMGLGTSFPSSKLHVVGTGGFSIDLKVNGRISTGDAQNGGGMWVSEANGMFVGQSSANSLGFFNNGWGFVLNSSGNVGVGTISPDEKLTVNGKIHATSIKIESTVPTPDYVFENSYQLLSLEEIKAYIDKNKHLPEVPSAKEIEKNGIDVGEMNMLLLKKVEELTLYVIELKKRDQIQQAEIELLMKK